MPPPKRRRIEVRNGQADDEERPVYPPEKYKHHLACPFPKHNPGLYLTVNNVCTERWGFKDIGDLNYHIQRVHSLQLGCIVCKSRFTQSKKGQSKKATVEQAKLSHECKPRDFTDEDPQWMTEEQELRLANWKEPGKAQEGGAKSWVKIYMCLFETTENDVPSPYYDYMVPNHLVSSSSRNDTYTLPVNADSIDPSLAQTVASETQRIGNPGPLEDQQGLRLDLNALDKHQSDDNYPFDWTVKPAIDSGYGTQEQREGDSSFPEDPYPSIAPHLLHSEYTSAAVMFTTGNSEEAGVNYTEYLNLEEETLGDSSNG